MKMAEVIRNHLLTTVNFLMITIEFVEFNINHSFFLLLKSFERNRLKLKTTVGESLNQKHSEKSTIHIFFWGKLSRVNK